MAGGHVDAVVNALIASSRAGMNIPFEMAAAIDLAGRDVLEAVRMVLILRLLRHLIFQQLPRMVLNC